MVIYLLCRQVTNTKLLPRDVVHQWLDRESVDRVIDEVFSIEHFASIIMEFVS